MIPSEENYWFIPGSLVLLIVLIAAVAFFFYQVYRRYRLLRLGKNENRFDRPGERIKGVLVYFLAQWRVLIGRAYAGPMHAIIFWGFLVISLGTLDTFGKGLSQGFAFPLLEDNRFFFLLLDVMEVLVIIALAMAAYRRLIWRPASLSYTADAFIILGLIFALMVTDLVADGLRLSLQPSALASWSPVGNALSKVFDGWDVGLQRGLFRFFWWSHALILLSFLVYLPSSKHLHILTSLFNVYFRSLAPKGALTPILGMETAESFGAAGVADFSWKHLLDTYTCTQCGRCQDNCPAYATQKPLSPKKIVQDLKASLYEVGPALLRGNADNPGRSLVGDLITEDELWACTTCRNCHEFCPLLIEPMAKVIEMRRNLVMMESRFPETAMLSLRNMEMRGHPWRGTQLSRTDWTQSLKVREFGKDGPGEILFWVGCTGALEERSVKSTIAFAKILLRAEVDFGILGMEESCTGDPARRMGNEYLFQIMAQRNIEVLNGYNVKKIVTQCPHCYNTLKNEYPQFGGNYEVIHHSQFLAQLIEQGRLKLNSEIVGKIAYHDPCYLGRYNDIYDSPRQVMKALPGTKAVELEPHHHKSFCCGAGGGRMWMEESLGTRINQRRTEHAIQAGADIVATACPFCLQMFEDGIKGKGVEESLHALDLAELVEKAL
ncbi:MAG: (Fe-S)-binding protein [Chloroflexi bacterium]|nr:(Fe-S)-binding protein [Chloroflexota bacterium]